MQSAESPGGAQVHYGIREHGMGLGHERHGAARGRAPARRDVLRVLATTCGPASAWPRSPGRHVLYSWTHDSVGLGEDGPTHQPVEHLASLRAMPGLAVVRPADANETAQAWRAAVEADGPVGLVLTAPGRARAGRDRRARRRGRAPRRLRPRRQRARPRDRADRHGQRGAALPRGGTDAGGRGSVGAAWSRCRAGSGSRSSPTTTGPACCRRACRS